MTPASEREIMIAAIAELLRGSRHVAVGASSPIPAAGAMLLQALAQQAGLPPVRISILGSVRDNFFTNGSTELFDCAAQGRIDAFFLSGGQIDGRGNINLVGIGNYPRTDVRWPGSFGSAFLYYVVPKVILFREDHTPRIFVDKVAALLTGKALFRFDKDRQGFALQSIHPGHDLPEIRDATGFGFAHDEIPATTPVPDAATLDMLRHDVLDTLAKTYPDFAAQWHADVHA